MREKNKEIKKTEHVLGSGLDFASREAYNLLRTNITFAFPDESSGKLIGITSACPQEGKSTTSINLAYALADAGYRVLMMDCDMRRPSVSEALKIEAEPGLSDTLSGKSEPLIYTGILHENLSVLTSGHIPPNPSELLGSNRMKELLEGYREEYDYIIVDLPPVLSVSDAVVASKYLNGMLIVVRHRATKRREVREVVRQLEFVDAKILGFVYNRVGTRGSKQYRNMKKKYYKSYESAAEKE